MLLREAFLSERFSAVYLYLRYPPWSWASRFQGAWYFQPPVRPSYRSHERPSAMVGERERIKSILVELVTQSFLLCAPPFGTAHSETLSPLRFASLLRAAQASVELWVLWSSQIFAESNRYQQQKGEQDDVTEPSWFPFPSNAMANQDNHESSDDSRTPVTQVWPWKYWSSQYHA